MMPPLMTVGSNPAASISAAMSEVVVVFAVRTAHRNGVFQAHKLGEHFRPAHHRNAFGARGTSSGLSRLTAEETTKRARPVHILAPVPDMDNRALGAQALHIGTVLDVRSGNPVAQIEHHLGNAAHPDPANT